jgi:transcriptional regulator GlxA family with amidase domain
LDFAALLILFRKGHLMGCRRDQPKDWAELGRQANYSTARLAALCGVSVRQLERDFRKTVCQSPKRWLNELRLRSARKLLQDGGSVKETALSSGYKHPQHFSRDFRKFFGASPSGEHRSDAASHSMQITEKLR